MEQFFNAYKFSNHDNNKFLILLQKGVYPYECFGDWRKLNGISLPEEEDFSSRFPDADYPHVKRVCKEFATRKFKVIHYF